MNKDLEFLRNLQTKLKHQDKYENDCQASPRFWVIADYIWMPVNEEDASRFSVYLPETQELFVLEDFIVNQTNHSESLSEEAQDEISFLYDYRDEFDWVKEHIDSDAILIPESLVHKICKNTMFLTKEEAKLHLKLNHYHYTKKAHTYAMTAWRSPEVEKLVDILMNFDWDIVERMIRNEKV